MRKNQAKDKKQKTIDIEATDPFEDTPPKYLNNEK